MIVPEKDMITMDREYFEELLESVAERAAAKTLEGVGLGDDYAGVDVRNLRDLLKSWRVVKRTALQTVVKTITTAILAALVIGFAVKMKLLGG